MKFAEIVNAVYEGVSLADLEALVSDLASEKASEMEGPNSPEYDRLTEKFYEEMMEELYALRD